MNTEPVKLKSGKITFLSALIILFASFFFSVSADLPHIFFCCLFFLVFSLLMRRPVKVSDRSIIYFSVIAVTLTTLLDIVFPMDKERFGIIGIFFHPNIVVPLFLYLACAATFFINCPVMIGASVTAAMAAMALGGDVFAANTVNERLPMFNFAITNIYPFFIAVLAFEFILIFIALKAYLPDSQLRTPVKLLLRKRLLQLLLLLIIPVAVYGAMRLHDKYQNVIRKLENMLMRSGIERRARYHSKIIFSKQIDLRRTIADDVIKYQEIILLRVVGPVSPDYLRSRAYTVYRDGQWFNPENVKLYPLRDKKYGGMLAFKTFYYGQNEHNGGNLSFNIFPAGVFDGKALPVPGGSVVFDLIASKLIASSDGELNPEDWEKDGGYTVRFPKNGMEVFPLPVPAAHDNTYLQVPETIAGELRLILQSIPGGIDGNVKDSTFINNLLNFYRKNYQYQLLNQAASENTDPVLHFLKQTRKGHCELFASSAALLLRSRGIMTRYVTGFFSQEKHPSGNYYTVRVGNAHAWLEAYAADLKKWILVEPTPPSAIPALQHQWGIFEPWNDQLKQILNQTLADMRRGYFAKGIVAVAGGIMTFFFNLLWHPIRGPIFLFIFVLWLYSRNKRRKKTHAAIIEISPDTIALSNEFRKLDRYLIKRFNIKHNKILTSSELIDYIRQSAPQAVELIALLEQYQSVRYRQNPPSEEQVREFKVQLKKACRTL